MALHFLPIPGLDIPPPTVALTWPPHDRQSRRSYDILKGLFLEAWVTEARYLTRGEQAQKVSDLCTSMLDLARLGGVS